MNFIKISWGVQFPVLLGVILCAMGFLLSNRLGARCTQWASTSRVPLRPRLGAPPPCRRSHVVVRMGIKAVENFDSSFELEEEVGKTARIGAVSLIDWGSRRVELI